MSFVAVILDKKLPLRGKRACGPNNGCANRAICFRWTLRDQNQPARFKNGLTKSGHISINGVFLHFEFPETKDPHGTERRQQRRRLSFSESLLHKTSP